MSESPSERRRRLINLGELIALAALIVSAVGVIVDRSGAAKPDFGCPFVSLIEMDMETFPADKLPPDLAKISAVKPGSK